MKNVSNTIKKIGLVSFCFLSSFINGYSQRIVVSPTIPNNGTGVGLPGRVVSVSSGTGLTAILSTAVADTTYLLGAGTYTVTPSIMDSNRVSVNAVQGIVMQNKTNITIRGIPGSTVLNGRASAGELLYLSNCSNIRIEGIQFDAWTNHNFIAWSFGLNYLWSTLSIYNSANVTVDNCFFNGGMDHGVVDYSAQQATLNTPSTNNIRITNNRFEDYGSWRSLDGVVVYADGTCIVPVGGWLIANNTFRYSHRGVEPYEDSGNFVQKGCIVRDNKAENMAEFFFSNAGSTNIHFGVLSGNYVFNMRTWSWRGTNYGFGGYGTDAGIALNGGRGWRINDNYVEGTFYNAYRIGVSSGSPVDDCELKNNTAVDIDRGDGLGYGFWIGDNTGDTALKANNVRNLIMTGNSARRCAYGAYRIFSGRDIVFENNTAYQGTLYTAWAATSSAFLAGRDGYTVNRITNLIVRGNTMMDGGVGAPYGYVLNDNIQSATFENNISVGYAAVGGLTNRSSSAVAISGHARSFIATIDLPSIGVGSQFTTNFTATGVSTNDAATIHIPAQFYASGNTTNMVANAWCSNATVYVKFANNDTVSAADAPSVRITATVRQFQAE
jgi:hypothetical protein